ncbi:zinc knuckle [Trichuris suis]|nr:zinc knuckle [Trichuris suis]
MRLTSRSNTLPARMLDEYQRRVENCGKSENGGFAYACRQEKAANPAQWKVQEPQRKEDRKCFFCKKHGHLKADCRAFKRLEKGRRPTPDEESVAAAKHVSFAMRDGPCTAAKRRWFIDSRASTHMTSDKSFFETLRTLKQQVFQADGTAVYTDGIGEG